MCLCSCSTFSFYHIEVREKNVSQKEKLEHLKYKPFSLELFPLVVVHIVVDCAALPY